MVVDRKVALLNSNNIQDMPNMEMMVHTEGPIVDSFYDVCLLSWDKKLTPPLPLLNKPATLRDLTTDPYKFGKDNELIGMKDLLNPAAVQEAREGKLNPAGDGSCTCLVSSGYAKRC